MKRSFRRVPSGRPLLHCASIVVTEIINLSSNHPFPFENSIPNLGIQCPINLKRTYEQTLSLSSRKGGGDIGGRQMPSFVMRVPCHAE